MELEKLAKLFEVLRNDYKLDHVDVMILSCIHELSKQGEVFTMQFIKQFKYASQATSHAHMKHLIREGFLVRNYDDTNLRIKKLELTSKALDLIADLRGV